MFGKGLLLAAINRERKSQNTTQATGPDEAIQDRKEGYPFTILVYLDEPLKSLYSTVFFDEEALAKLVAVINSESQSKRVVSLYIRPPEIQANMTSPLAVHILLPEKFPLEIDYLHDGTVFYKLGLPIETSSVLGVDECPLADMDDVRIAHPNERHYVSVEVTSKRGTNKMQTAEQAIARERNHPSYVCNKKPEWKVRTLSELLDSHSTRLRRDKASKERQVASCTSAVPLVEVEAAEIFCKDNPWSLYRPISLNERGLTSSTEAVLGTSEESSEDSLSGSLSPG